MENTFELEMQECLEEDLKTLESKSIEEINKLKGELEELKKTKDQDVSLELEAERKIALHKELTKDELKKKKKRKKWVHEEEEFNEEAHNWQKELVKIEFKIRDDEIHIETLEHQLERQKEELSSKHDEIVDFAKWNDNNKLLSLTPKAMATKIKIDFKPYVDEDEREFPELNFSFEYEEEVKMFEKTKVINVTDLKSIKVKSFDITKKDNFKDKVAEITELLEFTNRELLYDHLVKVIKKEKGAKYIKEYLAD